ncbi:cobalamin-binding protein [Azorhizobium doebereinerae]|uniref:cobalamin-binding protein n=1 Tax=Azorhizobium doebereinerae TaxID=281091 RepID=UPI00041F631A|nr:cobalamin-binding protein [Azorhizobium doebereinerae]
MTSPAPRVGFPPRRIVCLTEETVETLYLLGQEDLIVGVSGYAVRPARVRLEKPRVSGFTTADLPKILSLKPDLVLAFSDLQAGIVADLMRAGCAVHAFNQRDIAGILTMIRTVAALVGVPEKGNDLAEVLAGRLITTGERARRLPHRPRVYFEEWDAPMICGIGWVSELVTLAGGEDVFAHKALGSTATDRTVTPEEVIAAAPDLVIGSWCGKRFNPAAFAARPGFSALPAVRTGALTEVRSPLILQPGPAALTDGLDALERLIHGWAEARSHAEAAAS